MVRGNGGWKRTVRVLPPGMASAAFSSSARLFGFAATKSRTASSSASLRSASSATLRMVAMVVPPGIPCRGS